MSQDQDWVAAAHTLAVNVAGTGSRWYGPVAATPRHLLLPRWFWHPARDSNDWVVGDGPSDPRRWLRVAYDDQTWVTRVGGVHADDAEHGVTYTGTPTSSSTHPSLLVGMLRHARIGDSMDLLDVGTGSGYLTALACHRLGSRHVTSVDVDPYLTATAAERLADIDLNPTIVTVDATGPLPGEHDRLIATVSVPSVPASWLSTVRTNGRMVFVVEPVRAIITVTRTPDGGATGVVTKDSAGFMPVRQGDDYPTSDLPDADGDGEQVSIGRYPVVDLNAGWELASMFRLAEPEARVVCKQTGGRRMLRLAHPDGSWARAETQGGELPVVHQSGPRRLWDSYERIMDEWVDRGGQFPLHGASVTIEPDGGMLLRRGDWATRVG